jgi:hypothetical protein
MFKVFADVMLPSLCLPVTPSANPSLHGFLPVPGQTKPAASAPFGWNYKPAEKHCWLIFFRENTIPAEKQAE